MSRSEKNRHRYKNHFLLNALIELMLAAGKALFYILLFVLAYLDQTKWRVQRYDF